MDELHKHNVEDFFKAGTKAFIQKKFLFTDLREKNIDFIVQLIYTFIAGILYGL